MKKSLLTIAAALALVSCSQDELLPNGSETVTNGKIGANIFVPTTTRGAALNTVEDLISSQNGFDLISYYNLGGSYTEFMGTTDDGIQFKHDGSAWDYADRGEIHFWQSVPDEATDMKFFAVSPAKENLPADASYSIEADAQNITYTVPTEVSEQKDLMFAQKDLADGEYEPTSEVYRNGVPLNFHHALSQIVFKARIADKEDTDANGMSDYVKAYVNSVSVKNVHGAGTFDMAAASAILGETYYENGDLDGMDYTNGLWTATDGATNGYTVSDLTNNESIDWIEAADLTNGAIGTETAMLLLPQQLVALDLSSIGTDVNSANEEQIASVDRSTGAYLEVNCRVEYTNNDGEVTYIVGADASSFENIYIPISTNWNPGYKYVYTLVFSADSGDPVKAIVESVDEWNTAADIEKPGEEDNSMKYVSTASFTGFQIWNAEQLAQARDLINSGASYSVDDEGNITATRAVSGTYAQANYKLMADIDLSAYDNWEPIGNSTNKFGGNFNGNGKIISGLTIAYDYNLTPNENVVGLFGYIQGTGSQSIKNLSLQASISATANGTVYVGGIASYADEVTFANCHLLSNSSLTLSNNSASHGYIINYMGGIVGHALDVNIIACSNNADFSNNVGGNINRLGGIVGYVSGNIVACYNLGTLTRNVSSVQIGGIVGLFSQSNGFIKACYNTGRFGKYIAGDFNRSTEDTIIENCYSVYEEGNDFIIDSYTNSVGNCATIEEGGDWTAARDAMNNALIELAEEDGTGLYEWHYEPGTGDVPLILKKGLATKVKIELTQAEKNALHLTSKFTMMNASNISTSGIGFIEEYSATQDGANTDTYFSYNELYQANALNSVIASDDGNYYRLPTAGELQMLIPASNINFSRDSESNHTTTETETVYLENTADNYANVDGKTITGESTFFVSEEVSEYLPNSSDYLSTTAEANVVYALRFKGSSQYAAYRYSVMTGMQIEDNPGFGLNMLLIQVKALDEDDQTTDISTITNEDYWLERGNYNGGYSILKYA